MSVKELKLICLVLPDDKPDEHAVQVKIGSRLAVMHLKKLIKDVYAPSLAHMQTHDLVLWKCSGLPDDDTLERTLKTLRFDGSDHRLVRLSSVRRQLSQYFEDDDLSREPIHILIELPLLAKGEEEKHEARDRITELITNTCKKYKRSLEKNSTAPPEPPSASASEKSGRYIAFQEDAFVERPAKGKEEKDRARDRITELIANTRKHYKISLEKHTTAPPGPTSASASASAKSGGYIAFQEDAYGEPVYDGRWIASAPADTRAPPIQLYHPDFGHFQDEFTNEDVEVPAEVVRATTRFMGAVSGVYENDDTRRSAVRPKLLDVLSLGMEKTVNFNSTSSSGGGVVGSQALMMGEVAAICIEEEKNKFSEGDEDPSNQASLSYGRYWAQPNRANIRENSCCPSFLVAIAGASISVLGAVWTDKIIVQRLTDYVWLAHDAIFNDEAVYRNARILYALARSLRRLDAFYRSLMIHAKPAVLRELGPRYFPSVNAYRGSDGVIINFTYIVPLEPDSVCTTFLAKTDGPASDHIVVKFVHRYNKEAHELLAANGMAPRLRYCDKVGVREGDPSYSHLLMVVMDFVDGETLDKALTFPPGLGRQIRDILDVLHEADYVFGDLRAPNIVIKKNNEVMFIDFDMVGKHGESMYPIMMNPNIRWPVGVEDGLGVMLKEHDLEMLTRLVPGIWF